MSEIQTAIARVSDIIGIDKSDFMSNLEKWNKTKVYPVSLIDIKISADGVTDNAEQIAEIVSLFTTWSDDIIKNALDAESVTDAKKMIMEFKKYLSETRKLQTNPLKEVAGHYTPLEAKLDEASKALTTKFEAINEVEYQNRERAIREHFESRIKADGLTEIVGMDAFIDFIANKRKTNIFTAKGALTKGIKDAIDEALRVVVAPIQEAKALEEKKALQSKQFESYLDGIPSDGSVDLLEASKITLTKLRGSVEELYPDVVEACYRSIDNKISRCDSNIKAVQAIAEADAIKNADGQFMDIAYAEIKIASQNMTLGIEDLKILANELREIYPKLTFAENQEKVKSLGASLTQRITALELEEITPVVETPPTHRVIETDTYLVSIHDIEVLASMEIDAESEEEAKKELVRRFEAHLSMIDLMKKDV